MSFCNVIYIFLLIIFQYDSLVLPKLMRCKKRLSYGKLLREHAESERIYSLCWYFCSIQNSGLWAKDLKIGEYNEYVLVTNLMKHGNQYVIIERKCIKILLSVLLLMETYFDK